MSKESADRPPSGGGPKSKLKAPWKKGQSGNPKGRIPGKPNKATAEVKALAQHYTREAIRTLAGIMRDAEQPPQARVAAAKELLDRGHGKPAQSIDLSTTVFDARGHLLNLDKSHDG